MSTFDVGSLSTRVPSVVHDIYIRCISAREYEAAAKEYVLWLFLRRQNMSMDTGILCFGDNGQTGFPSIKPSNSLLTSYALIDEQPDMIIM
jgi:hypothetical protein